MGAFSAVAGAHAAAQRRNTLRIDSERVALSHAAGALVEPAAHQFLELLHNGVLRLEETLKFKPLAQRIRFTVSRRVRISSTYRSRVRLPLWRVQQSSAPYLHETTHVLMHSFARGVRSPTWLGEGFASYMESFVADHFGGYDAHLFTRGGNRSVDAEAREHLETAVGRQVLPYIGGAAEPPALSRDRQRVAPPFYVLSQSFVKFLIDRLGIEPVKNMHIADLKQLSIDNRIAAWLRSLNEKSP